ncbi:MAG: glycosyltransferase family 2 protein [Methanocellales archaeon]|nr:glycosyltransferase family 2 protein [Methanocellales archaeon]
MVTIVLPTKNEEKSIGKAIDAIKGFGYRILVVDAHSSDRTVEIAHAKGVEVIYDHGKGKGEALITAFKYAGDDVVYVDPDMTYPLEKISEFVEALTEGYDVVTGDRAAFGKKALPRALRVGDRISRTLFRLIYGRAVDNLSGFRGLSKRAIEKMKLKEEGFGIETEISAKAARLNMRMKNIPITYRPRLGKAKFRPVTDGLIVLKTILKYKLHSV